MNNKTIGIIAGVAVIIIAGGLMLSQQKKDSTVATQPTVPVTEPVTTPVTTPVVTPTPSGYTLAQVATHNSASSCWSAVNGNVYDLSSWIGNHPGGQEAILSICGKDGSAAFNGQHEGQQKQADVLAGFKIGALVK